MTTDPTKPPTPSNDDRSQPPDDAAAYVAAAYAAARDEAAARSARANEAAPRATPADGAAGHVTPADDTAARVPPRDETAARVAVANEDAARVAAAKAKAADGSAADAGPQDPDLDPSEEPIRTLLWTAATCRPLEEVAALVSLLRHTGEVPSPGDEALRAAAVARPLDEVRELVAMLNEAPHEVDEADTTLRAAAVGRPIEDVAQLVSILGHEESDHARSPAAEPAAARKSPVKTEAVTTPLAGSRDAAAEPAAGAERPGGRTPWPTVGTRGTVPSVGDALGDDTPSPALRSVLRWPAAVLLFACGVIHLPTDFAHLRSGGYADALSIAVTVLCLVFGVWLAVRDTVRVWAASAATAIGIVALHALASVGTVDLLESSLGESFAWADAAAVSCAAVGAVLAGSALLRRQKEPDTANGA
ncbi:hypothetical protein [Streptomyces chryseus]|uniref:hypothetical protein n=1 Tax=Streptomyces chryseus TaxID=68186 RepID=UPI0019BAEDD6|nr:hypothetical protein [Streptomyces chryseus]GGX14294.1 hypothetical protein GCM10010353_31980 [Streptomyces chryseus]